jgi:hypothetical protein
MSTGWVHSHNRCGVLRISRTPPQAHPAAARKPIAQRSPSPTAASAALPLSSPTPPMLNGGRRLSGLGAGKQDAAE